MSDFRDVIAEQATRTPAPQIAALDVPAEQVALEAVLREQVARHTAARDWDEDEYIAAHETIRLVTHPEAPMPRDADYPGFPAWLADRIAQNGAQA